MASSGMLLQALLALVFVLVLLYGVAAVARRVQHGQKGWQRTASSFATITGTQPLDFKHRLVRIAYHHKEYLLVLGGDQPVLLDALPQATPEAEPTP